MNCHAAIDRVYEALGDKPLPLAVRLELALHLLFCARCTGEIARLEAAAALLQTGCFPPSPGLGDAVMERLAVEGMELSIAGVPDDASEDLPSDTPWTGDTEGGVPLKGWVVTGLVVLVSLAASFTGMDFADVASSQGMSFLLPVGITMGAVVTGYGALFIGSHLKELSARFNLR